MDGIGTLLKDLEVTQNEILARLDRLEENHTNLASEQRGLAKSIGDVSENLSAKIRTLTEARFDPPGKRFVRLPELLEAVLFMLPIRDILLAQRVSKAFKNTIDGSIKLQRALFFLPESIDGEPRINDLFLNEKFFDAQRPLIEHAIIRLLSPFPRKSVHALFHEAQIMAGNGDASSRSLKITYRAQSCETGVERMRHRAEEPTSTTCEGCEKYPTPSKIEGGSWERMYLVQPPMYITWQSTAGQGVMVQDGSSQLWELVRFDTYSH